MIVISQALALTLVNTPGANNPLIGWHNLVTISGIEADHEAAGYPASNLANPSTPILQGWKSDSTADQYVTFDITSEDEVDYFGVANHNFGSGEVEVSIEYPDPESVDPENPDWIELIEPFIPGDDKPLLLRFVPTFLTQIRIKLAPGSVEPRMSVVYVGALLVMPRRIYVDHEPITLALDTSMQHNWSDGGDYLGSVLLNDKRSTAFPFQNLDPAWVRSDLDPFVKVCRKQPWFWAWRPGDYPNEIGFVVAMNNPKPRNQPGRNRMQIEFQVGGIAP